jgi:hypothetical protein
MIRGGRTFLSVAFKDLFVILFTTDPDTDGHPVAYRNKEREAL